MSIRLIIQLENGRPVIVEVDKEQFVIGRSQKCDVVIAEEGLSRQHCLVEVTNGEIYVTDLESANGVFIDDQKIPPSQKTRYFTTSRLTCGTAEIVEFTFIENQPDIPALEISSPGIGAPREAGSRSRPQSSKNKTASSSFDKSISKLHPGVRGFLVLALMGLGFFVFKNIMNGPSEEDELYQMQYDAAIKNKKNDGSIKTSNF